MKKILKALVFFVAIAFSSYSTFAVTQQTIDIADAEQFENALKEGSGSNKILNIKEDINLDLKGDEFTKAYVIPSDVKIVGNNKNLTLTNFPKKNMAVFNVTSASSGFEVSDLTINAPDKAGDNTLTPALFSFSATNAKFTNVTMNSNVAGSAGFALYFDGVANDVSFINSKINRGRLKFTNGSTGTLTLTNTEIDHTEFNKGHDNDEVFFYDGDKAAWTTTATGSTVKFDAARTIKNSGIAGLQNLQAAIPDALTVDTVWDINDAADLNAFLDSALKNQTINLKADIKLADITGAGVTYNFPDGTVVNGNNHTISIDHMINTAQKVFVAEGSLTIKDTKFIAPDKTDKADKVYYTPTLFAFDGDNAVVNFDNVKLSISDTTKNPGLGLYFYGVGNDVKFNKVEILKGRLLFDENSKGKFELNNSKLKEENPYKEELKDEVIFVADSAEWNMSAKNSTVSILGDVENGEYSTYKNLSKIVGEVNKIKGVKVNVDYKDPTKKINADIIVTDTVKQQINKAKTKVDYTIASFNEYVNVKFDKSSLDDEIKDKALEAIDKNLEEEDNKITRSFIYDVNGVSPVNQAVVATNSGASIDIEMTVPSEFKGAKDLSIYYIDANGTAKEVSSTHKDGKIAFTTNHFSNYAIVETKAIDDKVYDGDLPITGMNSIAPFMAIITSIALVGACTTRYARNKR